MTACCDSFSSKSHRVCVISALCLTLGDGKALRYGFRLGRDGFEWSGTGSAASPGRGRSPAVRPVPGRYLCLGRIDYRIHSSNDPTSTGKLVSSGCIRLINADVIDLHNLVGNHRGSTGDPAAAAAGPAFACRDAH